MIRPQHLALALPLALCAWSSNKPVESAPPEPVEWPEVEPLEGDRSVEQHLDMIILETRRHLGRKQVKLRVRNRSSQDLEFRYALEWKNRRGEIIGGYHHDWTPLTLAGGESTVLTIQGPTNAAETWRLHAESLESNSEEAEAAPSN